MLLTTTLTAAIFTRRFVTQTLYSYHRVRAILQSKLRLRALQAPHCNYRWVWKPGKQITFCWEEKKKELSMKLHPSFLLIMSLHVLGEGSPIDRLKTTVTICFPSACLSTLSGGINPFCLFVELIWFVLSSPDLHQHFPDSSTEWKSWFWPRGGWTHSRGFMASHASKNVIYYVCAYSPSH